jgi:hypothetical protein
MDLREIVSFEKAYGLVKWIQLISLELKELGAGLLIMQHSRGVPTKPSINLMNKIGLIHLIVSSVFFGLT